MFLHVNGFRLVENENENDLKVRVYESVALGVSPLLYGDFSFSQMDFYFIYEMMMAAALLSKRTFKSYMNKIAFIFSMG